MWSTVAEHDTLSIMCRRRSGQRNTCRLDTCGPTLGRCQADTWMARPCTSMKAPLLRMTSQMCSTGDYTR
jgi:hypothetical protein